MVASPFIATFIVLCFLGILDSGYLVWKHRKNSHTPLVCPLDHDCSKVTESKWSRILGIRNELLGMIFYFTVGMLLLFRVFEVSSVTPFLYGVIDFLLYQFAPLLILLTAGGTLFSLFLLYIQVRIIKDYCFYCLISALINVLLFLNSLAL